MQPICEVMNTKLEQAEEKNTEATLVMLMNDRNMYVARQ